MRRTIELKHVGPKQHVQALLDQLIDRLETRCSHVPKDAVSIHAVFEENKAHKLYRASLSCHLPRSLVAAHEEDRDAGRAIRGAFAELERQLDKRLALRSHERVRRDRKRKLLAAVLLGLGLPGGQAWASEQPPPPSAASPEAEAALHQLESADVYQRQLAFLQLEALREPATAAAIAPYAERRDPDVRAQSLRALAAIQGVEAVPRLLQALQHDRDPRVRWAALQGLEPLWEAHPGIVPAAIRALRDPSTEVRIAAVDVVSRLADPRAKEALLARDQFERRADVRRVLGPALTRAGITRHRDARLAP